jgi:hypothetical protein
MLGGCTDRGSGASLPRDNRILAASEYDGALTAAEVAAL